MRRNVNKLATLVMTGMLAALMSFGAFAEDSEAKTGKTETGYVVELPVHVKVDVDNAENPRVSAPKTSFTVSIGDGDTEKKEEELEYEKVNEETGEKEKAYRPYVIKPDKTEGRTFTITAADFSDEKDKPVLEQNLSLFYYTKPITITIPNSNYKAPGVYSYTVTQDAGKYTGIDYDKKTYYMYVSVINDRDNWNGVVIDSVVITDENGHKHQSIDNEFETTVLTIAPLALTGNAAERNRDYKYSVSIKPKSKLSEETTRKSSEADFVTSDKQEFTIWDINGTNLLTTINAEDINNGAEIELGSGKGVLIFGLTEDYDVYIKKLDADDEGYKTTYTYNSVTDKTGEDVKNAIKESGMTKNHQVILGEIKGGYIQFENFRNNITPTGVAMDVAPYALMVALAGGAAFVFLRKKESFED